jgi:AGZA family xanthine/uracil permease-like MFS transporter
MGFKERFNTEGINQKVAKSFVGRWFRLEGSGHPLERPGSKFMTELRAGTVTAAAMLYVSSSPEKLTL